MLPPLATWRAAWVGAGAHMASMREERFSPEKMLACFIPFFLTVHQFSKAAVIACSVDWEKDQQSMCGRYEEGKGQGGGRGLHTVALPWWEGETENERERRRKGAL